MLAAAILVTSGLLLFSIPASNGCTCLFRHPQQVVCESDFVIKGVQIGDREVPFSDDNLPPVGGNRIYTILVKVVYKGNKTIQEGSEIEVSTGLNSAACGVNVTPEVLWLLTGRISVVKGKTVYSISLCDWNRECSTLTPQQLGFLGTGETYFGRRNKNCKKCKITRCPNNDCSAVKATATTCLTDAKQCYGETLSCQYKRKGCQWRGKQDAKKCIGSKEKEVKMI
ncbi:metalloproteinase inhibitor 2-like [Argopecten irradians]|uniref:metalloproteinase inhibitor 2-like n=1 Tax=Argopecten irradians TaxID=31199 RepID=UPI003720BFC7